MVTKNHIHEMYFVQILEFIENIGRILVVSLIDICLWLEENTWEVKETFHILKTHSNL